MLLCRLWFHCCPCFQRRSLAVSSAQADSAHSTDHHCSLTAFLKRKCLGERQANLISSYFLLTPFSVLPVKIAAEIGPERTVSMFQKHGNICTHKARSDPSEWRVGFTFQFQHKCGKMRQLTWYFLKYYKSGWAHLTDISVVSSVTESRALRLSLWEKDEVQFGS